MRTMTEWRDIPGYKYPYRISSEGVVQQLDRGKWRDLTVRLRSGVRAEVRLRRMDGKQVHRGVFRLLDEYFRGGYARKRGLKISPKNGAKMDCTLDNMAYKTQAEIGRKSRSRSAKKPVLRYDKHGNATIYGSVIEAARKNGMSASSLDRRLYGGVLDPRGYRWEVLR